MFLECCEKIKLRSTFYEEETFKTLGVYTLQPIDVVENHNVYKHENSNKHIAFSTNHGWTVTTATDLNSYINSLINIKEIFTAFSKYCINNYQFRSTRTNPMTLIRLW